MWKTIIEDFKKEIDNSGSWIVRNVVWIILGVVSFIVLGPKYFDAMIKLLATITIVWSLVMFLSGLSVFIYTKVKFLSLSPETMVMILGSIFKGICILGSVICAGTYLAQFISPGSTPLP